MRRSGGGIAESVGADIAVSGVGVIELPFVDMELDFVVSFGNLRVVEGIG